MAKTFLGKANVPVIFLIIAKILQYILEIPLENSFSQWEYLEISEIESSMIYKLNFSYSTVTLMAGIIMHLPTFC